MTVMHAGSMAAARACHMALMQCCVQWVMMTPAGQWYICSSTGRVTVRPGHGITTRSVVRLSCAAELMWQFQTAKQLLSDRHLGGVLNSASALHLPARGSRHKTMQAPQ